MLRLVRVRLFELLDYRIRVLRELPRVVRYDRWAAPGPALDAELVQLLLEEMIVVQVLTTLSSGAPRAGRGVSRAVPVMRGSVVLFRRIPGG